MLDWLTLLIHPGSNKTPFLIVFCSSMFAFGIPILNKWLFFHALHSSCVSNFSLSQILTLSSLPLHFPVCIWAMRHLPPGRPSWCNQSPLYLSYPISISSLHKANSFLFTNLIFIFQFVYLSLTSFPYILVSMTLSSVFFSIFISLFVCLCLLINI